jgi:3-phenylpropionate/trans-cinnamate dioxygenase ferredoxin reductase subunit
MGLEVRVVVAADVLLARTFPEEIRRFLLDVHLMRGVKFLFDSRVAAFDTQPGGRTEVTLNDGQVLSADLIVVGIGAEPNVGLAAEAGLDCDNGILVDEDARTSDPAIFAAGDCTSHPNRLFGGRLRLETVHNAVEQGRTAGASVAGASLPYVQAPWVWSDQYALRLQAVGVSSEDATKVVRGKPGAAGFSVFHFDGDRLLAAQCVNQPAVFAAARRLLNQRLSISPAEVADMNLDLSGLAARPADLDFDVPWRPRHERRTLARGTVDA